MKITQIKLLALGATLLGFSTLWSIPATAAETMPAMDHSSMGHGAMSPAPADEPSEEMSGMDHSSMGHGSMSPAPADEPSEEMSGMDHSSMGHGAMSPAPVDEPSEEMSGMDHSSMGHGAMSPAPADGTSEAMSGMDHGSGAEMQPMSMQGGSAPADARDPHGYSGGYDFGPFPLHFADEAYMGSMVFNRLEQARADGETLTQYDAMGSFGKDYDKLIVKAEGEVDAGQLLEARTELLWGHALAPYWNTQLGVRFDSGLEPNQSWLAFGVQGLAPYWFEIDATAYIGEQGRTALRLGAEYELLLTQKLVLQPRAEFNIYGKSDATRDIGSGLTDAVAGLRLRYEITRQFAPYVGVESSTKLGATADIARAAGDKTSQNNWVAGVRFWF